MKKGELRRRSIIDTAEKMFLERGYDKTSVQDILDELNLSKGGFYHHFETKLAVLQEIANRRVFSQCDSMTREIRASKLSVTDRLNRLLALASLFEREQPEYIWLLLKLYYSEGDLSLRERNKELTLQYLLPPIEEVVAQGVREGVLFSRYPSRIARVILMLALCANDDACNLLYDNIDKPDCVIEIMEQINVYRDSIEVLLNAPYGSVQLFDVNISLNSMRAVIREYELEENEII